MRARALARLALCLGPSPAGRALHAVRTACDGQVAVVLLGNFPHAALEAVVARLNQGARSPHAERDV